MALEVTPTYPHLRTRVGFLGLQAEDLFAILALAVVANILGRFLHREMFGLPMNMVLQYVVPVLVISRAHAVLSTASSAVTSRTG